LSSYTGKIGGSGLNLARSIFISYQHKDRKKANGFRILRWNNNVDVEFHDNHLLSPVDSTNDQYIKRRINQEMDNTSVTVVIVGDKTKDSDWVDYEIERSIERGNGLVAIKADDSVDDEDVPDKIQEAGGEVVNWNPDEFGDAIERAAKQKSKIGGASPSSTAGTGC
jgi:hypothetical protein